MTFRNSFLIFVSQLLISSVIASDMGTTGLIDTPTARMRSDGEFSASISKQSLVDIYSLNYQATPWLETTFRYSAFTEIGFYDRSYEVKARLWKEGERLPEVAVGIRDILGTGVFSSEYLVASKKLGAFDLTLGLGWGRFADRSALSNPLAQAFDRFAERDQDTGRGGTVQFDTFFAGPDVGLFGGVAYDLESYNLRLVAEYNSDKYSRGVSDGLVHDPSPLSYGVEWEALPGVTLAGSHQFGEQWAFRIESRLDTALIPEPYPISYFESSIDLREKGEQPEGWNFESWYSALHYDFSQSGLVLREASRNLERTEVSLVFSNLQFALTADAIKQALTLAELHLPLSYRSINLILNDGDIQPVTINYQRQRTQDNQWVEASNRSIDLLVGRELEDPDFQTGYRNRHLAFSADLGTRFQLMDPDNPLRHQVHLTLGLSSRVGLGWRLRSSYVLNIDNNFDEISRPSNSVLPHVRSDVDRYLKEGATGLGHLYLNRQDSLSGDMFYRLYGGVLEEMYSGIGGEILYQPFRSRLAYGFSANWVKQRDYDKSFSHLDYDTITAFASVYWATPWYNYDLAIHAGRFLAKDLGAKFEIRRTFDNGWSIGAWATLTDVPFEDFGEGSFDKGIRIQVPLHSIFGTNTRSSYRTGIRSIQRDGGQMLESFTGTLWFELRENRYDALDRTTNRMVPR